MVERNGEDIHLSASNKIECNRLSMIRKKSVDSDYLHIPDRIGASLKTKHYNVRGILLREWIMSGFSVLNKRSLVNFPRLTPELMEYNRGRIRYPNYLFIVCENNGIPEIRKKSFTKAKTVLRLVLDHGN